MRQIYQLSLLLLGFTVAVNAQQFGTPVTGEGAMEANRIETEMANPNTSLKVKGTIQEVCQVKGCWMTMELGKERSMRVTFKDYGFFVPTSSSGRTAIMQGHLKTETIDVPTLRHFAKDAGQTEEQIEAITEPETELVFVAEGVLLVD